MMLGRDLDHRLGRREPTSRPREALANVSGVVGSLVDGLEVTVRRGEIVGMTGLLGSGFEELPYLIGGARPATAGTLSIDRDTIDLARATPRQCIDAGVALVPQSRAEAGLALELSVQENVTIPRVRSRGSPARLGAGWQREEAFRVVRELRVRPPDPALPVGILSGGNQQRVLLGKWLIGAPKLLVLHEPTQGVDVGARGDILEMIFRVAASGCGVLLAGLDASELAAMSDRVLVLRDGHIATELDGSRLTFDEIVTSVYGTRDVIARG
jgi:ribose transport system ATP-binding protein